MTLQDATRNYLHETLGIAPIGRAWPGAAKLPYFLQDGFDLQELKAANRTVILALNRGRKNPTAGVLRERIEKLKAAVKQPVVYVTFALESYQRKRLIEQKVPFIVPGNQMYLPDLGIDLREHFRQPHEEAREGLAPATQAMVLRALQFPDTQVEWNPAAVAKDLGYTAMTVSRAAKELAAAGVAKVDRRSRAIWLVMARPPAETWDLIKPLLRTPVKREFWARTREVVEQKRLPLAGLSALAFYTALADPPMPVYAIGPEQFKTATFNKLQPLPEAEPGACQLQVWTYAPLTVRGVKEGGKKVVDPLSLIAGLQANKDERIGLALDELQEHLPW